MNRKNELLSQLRIDRDEDDGYPVRKWPWVLAALLALIVTAVAAWVFSRPEALAVDLRLARPNQNAGQAVSVLDATGYVTARRYATVSSKVTAKVMEVLVEEGMRIEEGQVVARLDDSNARKNLALEQAGLTLARAQLEEIRTRLSEAERNRNRVAEMFRRELISEAELDAAESNFRSLQSQLKAREAQVLTAQRRVELQEQSLDDLTLRAPFTGVVISKDAQPGEMISPVSAGGGFTRTGICSLVDMTSLEIEVDVNESYIQRVAAGQPVTATLEAYPDWQIPARVVAIVPTADRQKATVRVRVGFEELDPRILPDMGVKVAFLEAEQTKPTMATVRRDIIIPRSAVHERNGSTVLFIVRDNRAWRREVELEARGDREYWVTGGLSPGERFVVNPPPDLEDGRVVTVN